MSEIRQFFIDHKEQWIKMIWLIGIVVVLIFIIKLLTIRTNKRSNKRAVTVGKMIFNILFYVIVIVAFFVGLSIWGVDIQNLLAGAGIMGVMIGLILRTLFSDLIAGVGIILENFYEIDEMIEIKGFTGRVLEVGMRTTRLINYKGEIKIFLNGDIREVTNLSRTYSLAMVDVLVDFSEDIEAVTNLLNTELPKMRPDFPDLLEDPYVLGVTQIHDDGFMLNVRAQTQPVSHYGVERELRKRILEIFSANNIKIPYKQSEFHVNLVKGE